MGVRDLVLVPDFGPFDAVSEVQHQAYTGSSLTEAVDHYRANIGWVLAAGDVTTGRFLRYVAARALADLGEHEESLAMAQELADEIDAAVDPLWRAKALALVAQASILLGRHGQALEGLAEAAELLERHPSRRHNHASAMMAVGTALQVAGVFDTADAMLVNLTTSTVPELHVLPEVVLLHATWAAFAELTGHPRAAHRHHATTLSGALRWRRVAVLAGEAGHVARSLACEAYSLQRLGCTDAAVAAVAGADLLAQVPSGRLEQVLARLYLGGACTESGQHGAARVHLEAALEEASHTGPGIWTGTSLAALADLDLAEHGEHPAVERWRTLARDLMAHLSTRSRAFGSELWARRRVLQLTHETDRMTRAVLQDPLTGLANRRALDEALARATREGRQVGACFVDVDDFKSVNDRYSHAVGDAVLRRIAEIVLAACRTEDVVARYGGDEFVVLTDGDAAVTEPVAERVRRAVAEHPWGDVAPDLGVTVSVGMAPSLPAAAVLAAADAAMLAAKRGGRDQVVTAR